MPRSFKTRALAALLTGLLLSSPAAQAQSATTAKPANQKATSEQSAKEAQRLAGQALEAETAGEWERAFALYSEAVGQMPGVGEYLMRRESARFQVVQQHVDRAERAALVGAVETARKELEAAIALDPSYDVARERLAQLQPPRRPASPALASAPPQLQPRPGTHSFDVRGEVRAAYEQIAKQFGLTASFDPEVRPRPIRFQAKEVDFATAMRVLGQQTGTFWIALDPHSFLVAENTPQKRRDLEPVVVSTIPLSGVTTPEEMTELVRMVREIAGINRTQLDTRTRTLTVRDTPEAVALATRLVEELELASGELMLEVEILEVDRNLMRRLGVTPPSTARTFTISPTDIREAQESPEGLLRVIQRVFGGPSVSGLLTGQSSLGSMIPPLIAIGGGRSVLLATLPGATAEFAEILSGLRGARRLMLRSRDAQQVTFFIGERFPVALAVLSPNFAGIQFGNIGENILSRTDFAAGDGLAALAAADFNNDGAIDLAVVNVNDNSISIFLGAGNGTFSSRTDFPVGTAPSAIVTADFNADGRADLAVANEMSNTVTILLGNGDGSFVATADVPTGTGPRGLVAADLNNDNRPDLAVANASSDSVTLILNSGGGNLAAAGDFPAGTQPRALVAADFNGDGNLDLAVANEGSNTVSLLLGTGMGSFVIGTGFQTGSAPVAIATADLNADGFADLLVVNQGDDTVSSVLGSGDGTFSTITEFAVGAGPVAVVVGDFSADGSLDLAVANQEGDSLTLLLGSGDGSFGFRADFQAGNGPAALVDADLTGDGRRDLVIANREEDSVSVIINQVPILPSAPFGAQSVQPYPGFQYEDLGLKVRATPRLHRQGEVTLQLEIEIRSRTGQELNGIPVISNRTVEQTVRLKENEPTILTGIIQRGETLGVLGWPGLARVPVAGKRSNEDRETELVISITPRRLRLADRVDRQYYTGREPGGGRGGAQPPPPQE